MVKVLIADDDADLRRLLQFLLTAWGYQVVSAEDGRHAMELLRDADGPRMALLDWDMPGATGPEVCRLSREDASTASAYLIILTGKEQKQDVVAALDSGADDYVVKPFDRAELKARLRVGVRIIQLQDSLAQKVVQLQDSLDQIRQLKKLIPICAYCKKIRDDDDHWQQVDDYIMTHVDVKFSHGICPDRFEDLVKDRGEK